MATVPTGRMERELRKLYLLWLSRLPYQQDLSGYVGLFRKQSERLIARMGGYTASLGALADFPAPKFLELSPFANIVYDQMKQSAIQSSLMIGMNPREVALRMFRVSMDKSYNRLLRLARTETVSAYWKNQWDSVAGHDLVMVWGAESGPRTCKSCLERDGLVVDDPTIRDHPNGRCTLLPTLPQMVEYKGTLLADGTVYHDPWWSQRSKISVNDRSVLL